MINLEKPLKLEDYLVHVTVFPPHFYEVNMDQGTVEQMALSRFANLGSVGMFFPKMKKTRFAV